MPPTYQPGDPLLASTRLGPVINAAAVQRYEKLLAEMPGNMAAAGQGRTDVAGRAATRSGPAVICAKATEPRTRSRSFPS